MNSSTTTSSHGHPAAYTPDTMIYVSGLPGPVPITEARDHQSRGRYLYDLYGTPLRPSTLQDEANTHAGNEQLVVPTDSPGHPTFGSKAANCGPSYVKPDDTADEAAHRRLLAELREHNEAARQRQEEKSKEVHKAEIRSRTFQGSSRYGRPKEELARARRGASRAPEGQPYNQQAYGYGCHDASSYSYGTEPVSHDSDSYSHIPASHQTSQPMAPLSQTSHIVQPSRSQNASYAPMVSFAAPYEQLAHPYSALGTFSRPKLATDSSHHATPPTMHPGSQGDAYADFQPTEPSYGCLQHAQPSYFVGAGHSNVYSFNSAGQHAGYQEQQLQTAQPAYFPRIESNFNAATHEAGYQQQHALRRTAWGRSSGPAPSPMHLQMQHTLVPAASDRRHVPAGNNEAYGGSANV